MENQVPPPTPTEAPPATALEQARQQFGAGLIAASQGDFSAALTALRAAQQLLDQAAAPAEQLRAEIATLTLVANLALQADSARAEWRHAEALAALEEALVQLAGLSDAATLEPVIAERRATLLAEQQRMAAEQQQFAEGEQLLAERRLDQAAACFQALTKALLPELRQRAEDRLRSVQAAIQDFEDTARQARRAPDPRAAAVDWQRAYDLWPHERAVAGNLAKALVRAGEAALVGGDAAAAGADFAQALKLKPGDATALAGQQQLAQLQAIGVALAQVRAELDQRQTLDTAADDRLRAQLAEQQRATMAYPIVQQELAALLAAIDQQQEHWRIIALADQQAATRAAAGDWAGAIELHAGALAALGTLLPPQAAARHATWQAAQEACIAAQHTAGQLLAQARSAYSGARSASDFAHIAAQLVQIEQALADALAQTQLVGLALPSELNALAEAAASLQQRVAAAEQALGAPIVAQGLSSIRAAMQLLEPDPTLRRIESDLAGRRSQQVPELLQRAQSAEDQEAISDAFDFLRQAHEIDPQHPGLAERLEQIERRRRFEEAVRRAEIDADVSGSSVTATRSALRRALEVFLSPEFAIPDATRATVRALLALADQEAGEALAKEEQWQRARTLREQFLSRVGWADRRAAQVAEQWLLVAREAALRGAISSLAKLGDLLGAYRTAFDYRRIYQNEEAIDLLERAQHDLRQSLVGQAEVLLSRAEAALGMGGYTAALDNLDRLERDYYGPIEREFPFLLNTLDENQEISTRRAEAQQLREQAEQLREQAEQLRQARDAAERAFLANQFAEAERLIQGITHNPRLSELKQSVDRLAERIARARGQHARAQLDDQLTLARIALKTEATAQQLDPLVAALEQAKQRLDWAALASSDRDELQHMIDQLGAARTSYATVLGLEADARQALERGDDERALLAFQQAAAATLDASKRARLMAELTGLEARVLRKRQQNEAIRMGRQQLDQRAWVEAQHSFAQARLAGADVELLLRTARAGELLDRARAAWEKRSALEAVEGDLDLAHELSADNPEAALIATELTYYSKQIKQRIATTRTEIKQARAALVRADLAAAELHIRNVLSWDQAHPEALELQAEQQQRATVHARDTQFSSLLDRAEQERKRGNDRTALAFAKEALDLRPNDPLAANLHTVLTREHEANEQLRQARKQIYSGKFRDAERLIQAAEIQASTPLLAEVQRQLEDLEAAYRANTTYPIRDLLRDERFAEALKRCKEALRYVQSDQLRADLDDLAATIVKRWAAQAIGQAQSRARAAGEEKIFSDIVSDLGELADELAGFPEVVKPIERQSRQVTIARLTFRLDRADRFLQQRARTSDPSTTSLDAAEPPEAAGTGLLSLAEARDLTKQTLVEATELGLEQLCLRARSQIAAIDARERAEQAEEAEQLLKRAASRPTGEQANEDISRARDLLEPQQQSPATVGLLDQIATSQRALKETNDAIAGAERALGSSSPNLAEARRQLRRPQAVYALLEPRYRQLESLLDLLERADELDEKQDWRGAFAAYQQAGQLDLTLAWLPKRRDRCQQKITDQVQAEVLAALRSVPPEPERASALLAEAEAAGWLHADANAQLADLRRWITSRQRVVAALALLDSRPPNPDRALDLLNEARQLYADPESDEQLAQWRLLAQVQLAQRGGDLQAAQHTFNQIRPPVAALALVRATQRSIHEQLLGQQRAVLLDALQTWDAATAAQALEQCLALAPNDNEIQRAAARQRQIAQCAPDLRQAMEGGWRALEQGGAPTTAGDPAAERYQVARQYFEKAIRIDDQFVEADQWRSCIQALERGGADLQAIEREPPAAAPRLYSSAAHWFELAQRALTTNADDPRPVLLGNSARQQARRSQAADAAAQLAASARTIEQLLLELHEYDRQQATGQITTELIERANAIFPAIKRQREELARLCRKPIIAAVESAYS